MDQDEKKDDQQQEERKEIVREVLVRCSDIPADEQSVIISLSNSKLQQALGGPKMPETQIFSKVAGAIKRELDAQFDSGWYVLCGKNYGTFVTHAKGSFLHFSVQDIHITVFRTR